MDAPLTGSAASGYLAVVMTSGRNDVRGIDAARLLRDARSWPRSAAARGRLALAATGIVRRAVAPPRVRARRRARFAAVAVSRASTREKLRPRRSWAP